MALSATILVTGLGENVQTYLIPHLTEEGYQVRLALGLCETLEQLHRGVDLALIDLPSAEEVIHIPTIREACTATIIVIGPARNDRLVVKALELGADDYVQRPFRTDELLARIRAQLRRRYGPNGILILGRLSLDLRGRWALHAGHPIELCPHAFTLLTTLAAQPGRIYPSDFLAHQVLGSSDLAHIRKLGDMINRLRNLIENDPQEPIILGGDVEHGYWISNLMRMANES